MRFENMFFQQSSIQKKLLLIANITNIALIAILLMISTGINDITNELLSDNDLTQMLAILSSIISVAIIVIIFFQWATVMIFKSLYNSRKNTNVNLRLIGVSSKELRSLYIKEILSIQKITIPSGLILALIAWFLISILFGDQTTRFLNSTSILGSIFIHLLINVIVTYMMLTRYVKRNVIDVLRGAEENTYIFKMNSLVIIRGVVALLISCVIFIVNSGIEDNTIYYLVQLLYLIPFLLCLDIIMVFINKIGIAISRKYKCSKFMLSELIGFNYFKRDKVVFLMVILSTTLFLGLQMMFVNTRIVARERVLDNIHYEMALMFEDFQEESFNKFENVFMGTYLKTELENGGNVHVYGIDSHYLNYFEDIILDDTLGDMTHEALLDYLDDETWNGIVLPQSFISKHDIGDKITLSYYEVELEFIVVGGYYMNNFSQLTAFTSKGYINNILGKSGYFNNVYLLDESEKNTVLSVFDDNAEILLREEIQIKSMEHAVQGTALVELTSIIIVIVSIIILVNLIAMSSKQNMRDMVKFRALGLSRSYVLKIYFNYVIAVISKAFLLGLVFATVFGKIGCYIILDKHYFAYGFKIMWLESLLLYTILILIAIASICLFSLKIIKNEHIELLRDFN